MERLRSLQPCSGALADPSGGHFEASTAVLTDYCRQRVVAWNVACNDPEHPARLTHYVEPHYSWLRDPSSKVLDSSQRTAGPNRRPFGWR
ncbi:MAG TPA: hypothetical protein VGY66_26080 [Gemmataceae bacterium]|nr:hypothetical protein [Gemmataceae bacterium]